MDSPKVMVIGICGPSGAGKTQLSFALEEHFQPPKEKPVEPTPDPRRPPKPKKKKRSAVGRPIIVHGDSHFHGTDCPTTEYGYKNQEVPEAYNYPAIIESVKQKKLELESLPSGPRVVLVEGFLLYCNPELMQLMDKKIFLLAERDTCFVRRRDRKIRKNPELFVDQFQKYVWPCFQENFKTYFEPLIEKNEVLLINTDQKTPEEILAEALKYIQG